MYHNIGEFIEEWGSESSLTSKLLRSLTDESLSLQIPNYKRTIGRLAWHLTGAIGEMMRSAGSQIDAVEETAPQPNSAASIADEYDKSSHNFIEKVKNWSQSELNEKVNMYGEMWSREYILRVLIVHQIHHRAQITVLMRLAGLQVPGLYGPSYEEWQKYGMAAQE